MSQNQSGKPPCWNCKFGMCVRMGEGKILSGEVKQRQREPWEEEEPVPEIETRSHNWLTTCWWNPSMGTDDAEFSDPNEMIDVQECSRYEKNDG